MKLLHIGFGNMVNIQRIVALVSPDSAPIKRLIQDTRDSDKLIDVTCGKKTRSVVITDSGHIILSAIQLDTVSNRALGEDQQEEAEESADV